MALWNNNTEIQFFIEALKNFASPEQLFYNLKDGYFAYVLKEGADAEGQTLQSRRTGNETPQKKYSGNSCPLAVILNVPQRTNRKTTYLYLITFRS